MRFSSLLCVLASLILSPAGAAQLTQPEVFQLMAAAGMSLKDRKVVNPCGHASEPKLKLIDLSGDGRPEAVSMDHDPACYGADPGYQSKILFEDKQGQWRVVGAVLGIFKPLLTRTGGYADFTLAGPGCQPIFAFNGEEYLISRPCAGAPPAVVDSKPAATPNSAVAADNKPLPAAAPTGHAPRDELAKFPDTYGSFAPAGDCTRTPRVTVSAQAVSLETNAGAGVFAHPAVMPNFNGPEDSSITYFLQGEGEGLIVSVLRNELTSSDGEHLGPAERAVSAVADKTPLRRCGAQVAEPPPEPGPAPMRNASAKTVAELADAAVMTDPGFKSAYLAALGAFARESWLIDMQGPGEQKPVTFAGAAYLQVTTCKPHDCGDNHMMVIYRPESGALYGVVTLRQRGARIGRPPAALARDLDRLAKAAWAPQ